MFISIGYQNFMKNFVFIIDISIVFPFGAYSDILTIFLGIIECVKLHKLGWGKMLQFIAYMVLCLQLVNF